MTYPINVSFYDDELVVINHNGEPYVPIKPIVENMELDWKDQDRKVKVRFESTVTILTTVAEDGKSREMICLPLRKLFGWLMTISPNKVKSEIKDKIIRYQNECDDVLWQHWTGRHQRIQDELNNAFVQESISEAKGSFYGKGLNSRKQEKQTNQRTILYLQTLIQPELTNFKTATKAVF
ncbi:phage antirepressor N-terminal domain-containing protein [Psychrobacter sp. SZ93C1]|uniref:phage antirepressor N-terminal domain-containing protein n=1 Tax=Psychrobacter sp. SZ93C1 TaxID=2792058 RepID=UPI0018CEC50C|nr:phage antirepressor N-terminal domain-containing protein [Psychrobacter sp. SZ93C1]MBH0066233.1 phage antirepressor N-terminal domain-containing protein [Psychrobacter sp. SZ93C1]